MSCRPKDLQLSLFEGNEAPRVVLATAQMVDLAALVEALLREILEETNLVIEPVALAGYRERVARDGSGKVEHHFVILPFAARWLAGEPVLNEELSEARWLRPAELTGLPTTPGLAEIVATAFGLLQEADLSARGPCGP